MEAIRRYREQNPAQIVQELIQFVRIPNSVYAVEQVQSNARALQEMLRSRSVRTELWDTATGRPLVYGELLTPGADQTMLVYGHYDGVPAEAQRWHSDPYEPVLRTDLPSGTAADWQTIPMPDNGQFEGHWRLFGRSVADSKNGIVAVLVALDALRSAGLRPGINLKFLFDGEEELESPSLATTLALHRHRLQADLVVNTSGERHQSGLPTVEFGVRGILMFDLTVYTSTTAMHSGHFGGFAPSAAFRLSHLLASMKGPDGQITIEGFYDDVVALTESEQQAIREIPGVEAEVCRQFGIARPEADTRLIQELINLPSLNVRGMQSGFVGEEARNIVPNTAMAEFDVRLVRGMDPDRTLACIVAHLQREGWLVLDRQPTPEELLKSERVVRVRKRAGFPATRTPLDSPIAAQVVQAVKRAAPGHVVILPTEGGSLPMYVFEQLGIPFVGLPTSNYDCNQHTDDENLKLSCLFEAIDLLGSLFVWNQGGTA